MCLSLSSQLAQKIRVERRLGSVQRDVIKQVYLICGSDINPAVDFCVILLIVLEAKAAREYVGIKLLDRTVSKFDAVSGATIWPDVQRKP